MICGVVFGLLFIAAGIYMLRTGQGWQVLSKRHADVTGSQARGEGVLAIIIGVALLVIFLFVR